MKNQSSIILKITFFKQLRSIFPFLVFFCSFTGAFYYYFKGVNLFDGEKGFVIIMLFVIAMLAYMTLPALFFHIDYLIRNRHEEYEIGNNMIIRRNNGVETVYSFEEIDDVCLYLFPTKFRDDFRLLAWDNYHFAKIVMKSGEELYLTSLLYPSGIDVVFKRYLKGMSYLSEKRWFPTTLVNYPLDKEYNVIDMEPRR